MTAQLPPVPRDTLRLFDGHSPDALRHPDARAFVIGRLLEDGDRADLKWLVTATGRDAIRDWVLARAQRQLSRRSRHFWETLFGIARPEPPDLRLWLQ